MASSARRCSSLSRSESRSQSAICSAARFWCRVFCDGLAARLRGLPAELGTMCRSACTSRSGGGGPSRRGIALAPGNIFPEALGRGRGVGVGEGTARSPGAVPGGAEQAATPSPLWLVPSGSAANFLLPPLKGRWGPLCGGHFLLPAGPWGPAGWRSPGSEGWGQSCMGGLNFRVSLAPFCAVWAREGRLARPATFPGDPGRYGSGALILAAWLSHYSASVCGREDDTSSFASHFASCSSVGTLPG